MTCFNSKIKKDKIPKKQAKFTKVNISKLEKGDCGIDHDLLMNYDTTIAKSIFSIPIRRKKES